MELRREEHIVLKLHQLRKDRVCQRVPCQAYQIGGAAVSLEIRLALRVCRGQAIWIDRVRLGQAKLLRVAVHQRHKMADGPPTASAIAMAASSPEGSISP